MNKLKSLIILGAGGHGKVVADCAQKTGCYQTIRFIDKRYGEIRQIGQWPVVGDAADFSAFQNADTEFFVAVGDNTTRARIQQELTLAGARLATLIHPSAVIGCEVTIGPGSLVLAGTVINPFSQIASGCIINTCASIDHDCVVEDFVHLAPGVRLAGSVTIRSGALMGIGSCAVPGTTIGLNSIVGAGATLIDDVADAVTVVGTPARIIGSK